MRIRLAALAAALLAGCRDAELSWLDARVPWREALPASAAPPAPATPAPAAVPAVAR